MKLFVFEGVLTDYTSGIAFALAKNPVEAKLKIYEKYLNSYNESYWGNGTRPKKWFIRQFKKYLMKEMSRQEWERITGTRFNSLAKEIMDMEPEIVSKAEGFYISGGG
jgi:hypothetical protein